jgi:hypothetical protein
MKKQAVISCPIDTYSGYGARARDFVKAFIEARPDLDVRILSQRWGNTRFGYLADHNEDDLISRILPQLQTKPDVWVQITVPNEFQSVGHYNIGVTAGMETTIAHATWVQGVNKMDLTLVSSQHAKDVFLNSKFEMKDNNGQPQGLVEVTKPIEVLFEGVNTDVYKQVSSDFDLSMVKEKYAYLFVGHWLQGDFGHDRKNIPYMIKTFLETFKGKMNRPALILKTQAATSSLMDKERILKKIEAVKKSVKGAGLPNIYVIHGEMSDSEMNSLYNHTKVKTMVSFTRGEGFGRPLLEFTTTGKPIIASGWSGQSDFLDVDKSFLLGGTLEKVHKSAAIKDMILEEAAWFKPNDNEVANAWKVSTKQYVKLLTNSKKQKSRTLREFTFNNMTDKLKEILDSNIEIVEQIQLNLPSLNLPQL